MPTKGHTSIIMLMYAPCWLRPLKPAVNGRLRHVYKTTGDVHPWLRQCTTLSNGAEK